MDGMMRSFNNQHLCPSLGACARPNSALLFEKVSGGHAETWRSWFSNMAEISYKLKLLTLTSR